MKRKVILLLLAASLLLTGCGWLDGRYVSAIPHREQRQNIQTDVIAASNYQDLMAALESLVAAGTENATINVADYPSDMIDGGIATAVRYARDTYPIGDYAVEDIHCELGTSGGVPALAVTITYRHSWAEIQRIHHLEDANAAEAVIAEALERYDANAVLLVEDYSSRDFTQLVQDYAAEHPETVMETPQVTVSIYGSGKSRVVELIFTYQNSRDALRQMRSQVKPVFNSAVLYVSGDGADRQKFSQLYGFLMERFDYTIETSITPAYSLLRHGVGDSRAFATVYAAMCREAGLECMTVTGTCSGEPRTWNMVLDNGHYYHVDLLRCNETGGYRELTDGEMRNYVWDYSAYPECTGAIAPETQETAPAQAGSPAEEAPVETEAATEPVSSTETTAATESAEKIEDF